MVFPVQCAREHDHSRLRAVLQSMCRLHFTTRCLSVFHDGFTKQGCFPVSFRGPL